MLFRKTTVEYLIFFEFSKKDNGTYAIDDLISRSKNISFQSKVQEIEKRVQGFKNFSDIANEIAQLIDKFYRFSIKLVYQILRQTEM